MPGFNCEKDNGDFIISYSNVLFNGTGDFQEEDNKILRIEHEDIDCDKYQVINDIPKLSAHHRNLGDVIKMLQKNIPSIKSCSTCLQVSDTHTCFVKKL